MLCEGGDLLRQLGLVEAALAGLSEVGGPNGIGLTDALRGLDVTSDTCTNHRWSVEDGDSADDLLDRLFVRGAFFNKAHDVRRASLV